MDPGDWIALAAALVALGAMGVAIWQAAEAKQSRVLADKARRDSLKPTFSLEWDGEQPTCTAADTKGWEPVNLRYEAGPNLTAIVVTPRKGSQVDKILPYPGLASRDATGHLEYTDVAAGDSKFFHAHLARGFGKIALAVHARSDEYEWEPIYVWTWAF